MTDAFIQLPLPTLPRRENTKINETIIEECEEIDENVENIGENNDFSTVHDVSTVQDDSFEIEQNGQPNLSASHTPSIFDENYLSFLIQKRRAQKAAEQQQQNEEDFRQISQI